MLHVPAMRLFRNHLTEWEGDDRALYVLRREGRREGGWYSEIFGDSLGQKGRRIKGGFTFAPECPCPARWAHVSPGHSTAVSAVP
jgi:hypothetical protein